MAAASADDSSGPMPASEMGTSTGLSEATDQAIESLARGDLSRFTQYAADYLLPSILYAACGLGIIFLGYLAASYLSRVISRPVCRRIDETLGRFIGRLVFYAILFGVTAAVLSKMGAPLGGLAAMLAAAGFAIGLAFQGTLSNFASGVLMLVFRPFKVGDVIDAAGVMGKVNEIDLFTTTLDTFDNRRIIIPNSAISASTIENVSYHPHRRVEVVVGVDYAADLRATRQALQRATDAFAENTIQGEGRGSAVVLSNLGDSAVQWKVRLWVASADVFPITEALTGEVKDQLDAANISIPFPQLDVHFKRVDEADAELLRRRGRVRPLRRSDPGERFGNGSVSAYAS
jgi:small conductance mechanosensitive channel